MDLSTAAGFPLTFDPDSMDVSAEEICFERSTRCYEDMKAVWMDPNPVVLNPVMYWTFKLASAGSLNKYFTSRHLTFGLVMVPPGKVGLEYLKTHGHYHSPIPGSQIGYPEVYTHFYGDLYLYLQRRSGPAGSRLDDCVLYPMVPGRSITIPPGYAHILINPSARPALMAGLYSTDAGHVYEPIDSMAGAAYYFIEQDGTMQVRQNPAYTNPPALRWLIQPEGDRFAPPDPETPLWESFLRNPEAYEFLYDPDAAHAHFVPEDLRL